MSESRFQPYVTKLQTKVASSSGQEETVYGVIATIPEREEELVRLVTETELKGFLEYVTDPEKTDQIKYNRFAHHKNALGSLRLEVRKQTTSWWPVTHLYVHHVENYSNYRHVGLALDEYNLRYSLMRGTGGRAREEASWSSHQFYLNCGHSVGGYVDSPTNRENNTEELRKKIAILAEQQKKVREQEIKQLDEQIQLKQAQQSNPEKKGELDKEIQQLQKRKAQLEKDNQRNLVDTSSLGSCMMYRSEDMIKQKMEQFRIAAPEDAIPKGNFRSADQVLGRKITALAELEVKVLSVSNEQKASIKKLATPAPKSRYALWQEEKKQYESLLNILPASLIGLKFDNLTGFPKKEISFVFSSEATKNEITDEDIFIAALKKSVGDRNVQVIEDKKNRIIKVTNNFTRVLNELGIGKESKSTFQEHAKQTVQKYARDRIDKPEYSGFRVGYSRTTKLAAALLFLAGKEPIEKGLKKAMSKGQLSNAVKKKMGK